ncbi:MAG: hypothetical protein AAF202_04300 [Pseudomonadota bacterium]
MRTFEVEAEQTGEVLTLRFIGYLNEDADLAKIPDPKGKSVVLNLEKVEGSNSLGLKKWINWINPLAQKVQLTFEKVPPAIVHQMSILSGFVPRGARINSIYVPFHCDSCGNEETILFENGSGFYTGTAETKPGYRIDEKRPCSKCGASLEIDAVPDRYFNFLFQK